MANNRPNRTYICAAHGAFLDDSGGRCPHGCGSGMVSLVEPPMLSVGRSRAVKDMVDREMVDIARSAGVSDLNIRAGRSAIPDDYRPNESREERLLRTGSQAYNVPAENFGNYLGGAGATGEASTLQVMKEQGQLAVKPMVDPRMNDNTKLT